MRHKAKAYLASVEGKADLRAAGVANAEVAGLGMNPLLLGKMVLDAPIHEDEVVF